MVILDDFRGVVSVFDDFRGFVRISDAFRWFVGNSDGFVDFRCFRWLALICWGFTWFRWCSMISMIVVEVQRFHRICLTFGALSGILMISMIFANFHGFHRISLIFVDLFGFPLISLIFVDIWRFFQFLTDFLVFGGFFGGPNLSRLEFGNSNEILVVLKSSFLLWKILGKSQNFCACGGEYTRAWFWRFFCNRHQATILVDFVKFYDHPRWQPRTGWRFRLFPLRERSLRALTARSLRVLVLKDP